MQKIKTKAINPADKPSREAGYTLTELLVVLVIIALLTGIVAPRLMGRIGGAKSTTARTQIENIVSALQIYRLDIGNYPTQEQGLDALIENPSDLTDWQGPYMRRGKVPLDPWKRDYVYSVSDDGETLLITSLGKDGRPGGEGENADVSSED